MAERNFTHNHCALEKKLVELFAVVNVGATGAPTLQKFDGPGNAQVLSAASAAGFKGIKSISRNSAGQYKVVLQDRYQRVLKCEVGFAQDAAPAAPVVHLMATGTDVRSATSPQITFQCRSTAAAATDPASGEVMQIRLILADSTAL